MTGLDNAVLNADPCVNSLAVPTVECSENACPVCSMFTCMWNDVCT